MSWVVDASALVEVLLRTETGQSVAELIDEDEMHAPDIVNAEVLSTLRRLVRIGTLEPARAETAVERLSRAPVERASTDSLIADVWSLRDQLTPYDACYVALARSLGCAIVTCDHRMSRAPGLGVPIVAL